jgi:uncharacterized protein
MTSVDDLGACNVVVLTTFRMDGSPVGTPVNVAVADGRAYVRTWASSAKAKRIAQNPSVRVGPSTYRGTATGPATAALARALTGSEARAAGRLIDRKFPIIQRLLVPIGHRLKRVQPIVYELTFDDATTTADGSEPSWDNEGP